VSPLEAVDDQEVTETHPEPLRVRLVAVEIHLEVVADDGVTLHPVQTPTQRYAAAEWPDFDLARVLAQIEAEVQKQLATG